MYLSKWGQSKLLERVSDHFDISLVNKICSQWKQHLSKKKKLS